MARIILGDGEIFTVVGGNNVIVGEAGTNQTVRVFGGTNVLSADFNQGGDRAIFNAPLASFRIDRSGSAIIFTGHLGLTLIVPAPSPVAPNGPIVLSFQDAAEGNPTDYILRNDALGRFFVGEREVGRDPPMPISFANQEPIEATSMLVNLGA